MSEESPGAGESIGRPIEHLGEKTRWKSLSEFTREHLENHEN
ncbi:hypothetical protein [Haladaptatus sp. NG-WS-4]